MMSRAELANAVFGLCVKDLRGEQSDKDIWKSIARTDDDSLLRWYGEHQQEQTS